MDTANNEKNAKKDSIAKNAAKKDKAPKKSWFKGMRSEFKKIVWTDRKTLVKQTTAVVAITAILMIIISVIDAIYTIGIDFLVK